MKRDRLNEMMNELMGNWNTYEPKRVEELQSNLETCIGELQHLARTGCASEMCGTNDPECSCVPCQIRRWNEAEK
jgi:hypothetical protein